MTTALPHHLSGIALVCNGETVINADDMAAYTGISPSTLQGLLGPCEVATVTVDHDYDPMRPWEWDSAPHEGAIIPLTRGRWIADSVICEDAPSWLLEALDHWEVDNGSHRDDYGVRCLQRLARMRGYVATVETLAGMSPSDWMDAIVIHKEDDSDCLQDWRTYWDEGGFVATVEMADSVFSETVATVGYDGIESLASELLRAGYEARRREIRAALA